MPLLAELQQLQQIKMNKWAELISKIFGFIKYLISFVKSQKQAQKEKENKKFEESKDHLKQVYQEIDNQKKEEQKTDTSISKIKDRLNERF